MVGWGAYFILDLATDYSNINNLAGLVSWFTSDFIGFVLSFGMRVIYRKVYINLKKPLPLILASILVSVLFANMWLTIRDLVHYLFIPWGLPGGYAWEYFNDHLRFTAIIIRFSVPLFGWSALYFGLKFSRQYFIERERALILKSQSNEARLRLLRYQLNPHFLFNSLNSIQALIYRNPEAADEMIAELSEFFRYSLTNNESTFVPLSYEISIVEKYLSIEKIRFGERLEFSIDISEKAGSREVLCFILQPLVENAVKHGMRLSGESLKIGIYADSSDSMLVIRVVNTGKWRESDDEGGYGMKNVEERLKNAYDDRFEFTWGEKDGKVVVSLKIKNQE